MQRPLWEMIVDLVSGVVPDDAAQWPVRVTGLSLDLPMEVVFRRTGPGEHDVALLADVPRWRWRTEFDLPLGRLRLRCGDSAERDRTDDLRDDQ